MSRATRTMAALILILIPTIEYGGLFLLKSLLDPNSRYMANPLHENFERAGHAHAGVIIILSLVVQILADYATLPALLLWLVRLAMPFAAILISAGFFLSVIGPFASHPFAMVPLIYAGACLLAFAVVLLAIGLLRAPRRSQQANP
jgi:hypothetical protein